MNKGSIYGNCIKSWEQSNYVWQLFLAIEEWQLDLGTIECVCLWVAGLFQPPFWQENLNLPCSAWGRHCCAIQIPNTGVQDSLTKAKGSTNSNESHVAKNNDISASDWPFYHIVHQWMSRTPAGDITQGWPCAAFYRRWSMSAPVAARYSHLRHIWAHSPDSVLSTWNSINGRIVGWILAVILLRLHRLLQQSSGKPSIDPRPCGNRYQRWVGSDYRVRL